MFSKPLKVSLPDGKRIVASIAKSGDMVQIKVPYLELVKKDKPEFAKNGVISFSVTQKLYQETITKLTQYLETLFLKGMSNEDIHPSFGTKSSSPRTKKSDTGRKNKRAERKRDSSSLYSGPRGDLPAEGIGGEEPESDMAESDYQGIEGSN